MNKSVLPAIILVICLFIYTFYLILEIYSISIKPVYKCVKSVPETTCRDASVCKAPGKSGQCWYYTIERQCVTKNVCLEYECVENCN